MKNITFINAGAGSGKTYRLTKVLSNYIVNKSIHANEILLTTFSKKAAKEIRERAQAELLEKHQFEEVSNLQSAFMGTVHSIGYQFIKKYWYLIGISPDLTEIDEKERDVFFSNAISEVPSNSKLARLNHLNYQFDFRSYDDIIDLPVYNKDQWKDDVMAIINNSLTNNINIIDDITSLNNSLERWNSIFKGQINKSYKEDILQELEELCIHNKAYKYNNPKKGLKADYINLMELELPFFKSKNNNKDLRSYFEIEDFISKIEKVYKGNDQILDRLKKLKIGADQTYIFHESGIEYTKLIFEIASESIKKYKNYKNENGLVDYTDMEVYFLELLDEEIVQKEIEKSIKLVLVDEFQDSNPIQLSIFIKLSNIIDEKLGHSYWVGDPKQSIYAFRGSDPILIGKVIKQFGKKENTNLKLELLKMSWRSVPELVTFSNALFEERMLEDTSEIYLESKEQIHGPDKNNEEQVIIEARKRFDEWLNNVSINPLNRKESIGLLPVRDSKKITYHPLQFWNFLSKTNKSIRSKQEYYDLFVKKTSSIIKEGKIIASEICVLVNSNKNVAELAKQFNRIGVTVNANVDGLTDTIEYRLIQNIVSLFIDPYNGLSSAELSYLFGEVPAVDDIIKNRLQFIQKYRDENGEIKYDKLKEWLVNNEHRTLITELRKQSKHLSVYYIIEKIISQFNIFLKLVRYNNSDLRQANTLKVLESAKAYETYCYKMNVGTNLSGLFDFIESSKEHMQFASSTNKDAINIMTYHKSKGLEWPMVILLDLEYNSSSEIEKKEFFKLKVNQPDQLNLQNPLKGRSLEFLFWPFGRSNSVKEEFKEKYFEELEELKTNKKNERSRLMYVGMTRAKDCLVFASNNYQKAYWLEDIVQNDWSLKEALEGIGYTTTTSGIFNFFNRHYKQQGDCNIYYEKIQPDRHFDHDLEPENGIYFKKEIPKSQNQSYVINPSSVKNIDDCKVIPFKDLHERLITKTPDSTELGNTLHQLLYIKNRSYFKEAVHKSEAFKTLGIESEQFIRHTELFNTWLKSEFEIEKEYHELPLEVMLNENLARGEADLVLETKEGLVLIDYKSFPGSESDISNENSEFYGGKYSGQLDLYSRMLHETFNNKVVRKLIYYVVQGKVVELES